MTNKTEFIVFMLKLSSKVYHVFSSLKNQTNVFQFYGMVKSCVYSCSIHELLGNWIFVYVFLGAKLENGVGGTPYSVARIVIHPMYVPSSPAFYHDIALIRLTPDVTNAPHVCLPVPGAPILSPRCIVAGE